MRKFLNFVPLAIGLFALTLFAVSGMLPTKAHAQAITSGGVITNSPGSGPVTSANGVFQCPSGVACSLQSSGNALTLSALGGWGLVVGGSGTGTVTLGATGQQTNVIGSAISIAGGSGVFVGSCVMSAGTTCTATVPTGAKCVAVTTTGGQVLKSVAVAATTVTVTATASGSDTWNIICL